MIQKEYSEFTKKILWWLNLRWAALAMIGGLFFKLFYGLPGIFLQIVFSAIFLMYLFSFWLWLAIKRDWIKSDKTLYVLSLVIHLLDLVAVFFQAFLILPLAEKLQYVPLLQLFNSTAFIYFLIIVCSSVVLGLTESILIGTLAAIFFAVQKYFFIAPDWNIGPNLLTGMEVVVFYYLGIFLLGFLARQAENKKNELDEINLELSQKIKDLEGHRKELIQLEKKASLHQLAVSLNHEINNPLTSILGNAQFFYEQFGKALPETLAIFKESVYDSLIEAKKIKELLRRIRKISEPIVSEYIPGIKMIDIDKASGK